MMDNIKKVTEYLLYIFIFLLPWQTRWIWYEGVLNSQHWEYGSFSLYGTDILVISIILLSFFVFRRQLRQANGWWSWLAGLFLVCFASIFWSQDKEMSWYGAGKLAEGLLLFWTVSRLKFSWSKVAYAFAASGLAQSGLGIYQFFSPSAS